LEVKQLQINLQIFYKAYSTASAAINLPLSN